MSVPGYDKNTPNLRVVGGTDSAPAALAGGGDPPHDGGMEARVAQLEASMKHVEKDVSDIKQDLRDFSKQNHDDFRDVRDAARTQFLWMVGAGASAFVLLAGLMIHGFHWL